LGPGPRLIKKEFTGPRSHKGWETPFYTMTLPIPPAGPKARRKLHFTEKKYEVKSGPLYCLSNTEFKSYNVVTAGRSCLFLICHTVFFVKLVVSRYLYWNFALKQNYLAYLVNLSWYKMFHNRCLISSHYLSVPLLYFSFTNAVNLSNCSVQV